MILVLQHLVENPEQFLTAYPHKFQVFRENPNGLEELVGYGLVELIAMEKAFVRASFRTLDGRSEQMTIANDDALRCFDAGMTIYFHALRWPRTDQWLRAIETDLNLIPNTASLSAFVSRQGPGLPFHWDENSNFICQGRGLKQFRVAENKFIKNPSVGHIIGQVPSERLTRELHGTKLPENPMELVPLITTTMTPGTVMFMPKGMWHDTRTLSDVSIHFNIQTRWPKWADAMLAVMNETSAPFDHELFREKIPGISSSREFAFVLADKFEGLARQLRENPEAKIFEKYGK